MRSFTRPELMYIGGQRRGIRILNVRKPAHMGPIYNFEGDTAPKIKSSMPIFQNHMSHK